MDEIIPSLVVLILGLLVMVRLQESLDRKEARWFWLGVGAHLAAFVVFVLLQQRSGRDSDMLRGMYKGRLIANDMHLDFWGVFPHTIAAFFQQPSGLNMPLFGGGSTDSMLILTAWTCFLVANSVWATNLVFVFGTLFGKLCLYRGLRSGFPKVLHDRVALAVFLVPSFVYWTSGVVKEAVAMIGVGLVVLGVSKLQANRQSAGVFRIVVGVLLVGLIKPYVLFVLSGALGVLFYYLRATRHGGVVRFRPVVLVLLVAFAVGAIIGLGYVFPKFSIENIAAEAASRQEYVFKSRAKSAIMMGDSRQRSALGQAMFAPVGLITAWFRPFLFEAHNVTALVSAIEGSLFLALAALVAVRQDPLTLWRALSRYPWLAFCASFAIVFGAIVGLVSGNLGTLVRYRVPLLPFFALLLLILSVPRERLNTLMDQDGDVGR